MLERMGYSESGKISSGDANFSNLVAQGSQESLRKAGMGENSPDQLIRSKSKVGAISGKHDPGTDILAQNIVGILGDRFGKFTAFNDSLHQEKHKSSSHTKGLGLDFTISSGNKTDYAKAANELREHLKSSGLNQGEFRIFDEANHPGNYTTAPHIHVEFATPQAAARYQSSFPTLASSSYSTTFGAITPIVASAESTSKSSSTTPSSIPPKPTPPKSMRELTEEGFSKTITSSLETFDLLNKLSGGQLGELSKDLREALRDPNISKELFVDGSSKTSSSNFTPISNYIPSVHDMHLGQKVYNI